MPIDIRLAAVPAASDVPLASHLSALGGGDASGRDVVVPVTDAGTAGLDSYLGAPTAEVLAACETTGRAGELTAVPASPGSGLGWVLFLGLGDGSEADLRKAGAALGRRVSAGRRVLTNAVYRQPAGSVQAFAEGLLLASYRFTLASDPGPPAGPAEVRLLVSAEGGEAGPVERAVTVAHAAALARDLANMPSRLKSPAWLADEAVRVAADGGLSARVWQPGELAQAGFGGLLAVGSGSAQPPRLIELGYQPPGWRTHIVLVGKGITFDSGGLSLKPTDNMTTMKTDMAGGAAVIAAMSVLGKLAAPVRVTGLIPAAENMPSGSAMRPGDVITHYGGITTEVLNTDAEGRLILADALAYADARLDPDAIVDLATLTGAARVALGTTIGALYASSDTLASELLSAAAAAGDPLWRMPLVDDYTDALESPVADLANVPHTGTRPHAGSIEAALFLREFTGGRPWAHLDIAGAARSTSDEGEYTKGATGFGTRALIRWLTGGPLAQGCAAG